MAPTNLMTGRMDLCSFHISILSKQVTKEPRTWVTEWEKQRREKMWEERLKAENAFVEFKLPRRSCGSFRPPRAVSNRYY